MTAPAVLVQGRARQLRPWTSPPLLGKRGHEYAARRVAAPTPSLPPRANLRPWQSPVWDQGARRTCAPFAWKSAAEYLQIRDARIAGAPKKPVDSLSAYSLAYAARVFVVGAQPASDPGFLNADLASAIETWGISRAAFWPDDEDHYARPPDERAVEDAASRRGLLALPLPTLRHLKASLAQGFPVVVGFALAESAESAEAARAGHFATPSPADPIVGAHDALAVGYDDERAQVDVKNSWGNGWGDGGYGTLEYAMWGDDEVDVSTQLANEQWALHSVGA